MPVIAVVNRKGGSGKSTLAAHLAAWYAQQGHTVMLGDIDRQQSTRSWLRKRSDDLPTISPWNVDQNILRVPKGITHVVLDTPGGLHGFDLARMVMFADVILMPVCGSAFDRESAADCIAELKTLPRIAAGRCKVACIGMRLDVRSRAPQTLKEWADALGLPFIGVLREASSYVQCLERGMTLFDLPADRIASDLAQWDPILNWLNHHLATLAIGGNAQALGASSQSATAAAPVIPSKLLAATPRAAPTQAAVVKARPAVPAAASTAPRAAPITVPGPARVATSAAIDSPQPAIPRSLFQNPGHSAPTAEMPHTPANRPVPSVTRVNNPRVLDRVAASATPQRASLAGEASNQAPLPLDEEASIPSFLKLVKC